MSKKRIAYHVASISLLTAPNMVYLGLNYNILQEANAISLTMTAILVASIIGIGTLAHLKLNAGVWATLVGVFVLSLSNIAYIAGIALIIEGAGMGIDGYVFKPLIEKEKIKEMENGGTAITYTKEIK